MHEEIQLAYLSHAELQCNTIKYHSLKKLQANLNSPCLSYL
jgi:hypothetical protein